MMMFQRFRPSGARTSCWLVAVLVATAALAIMGCGGAKAGSFQSMPTHVPLVERNYTFVAHGLKGEACKLSILGFGIGDRSYAEAVSQIHKMVPEQHHPDYQLVNVVEDRSFVFGLFMWESCTIVSADVVVLREPIAPLMVNTGSGPEVIDEPAAAVEAEIAAVADAFLGLGPNEQDHIAFEALWRRGDVTFDDAAKHVAEELRRRGLASSHRFHADGPLGQAIDEAFRRSLNRGDFRRPRHGIIRAVQPDPNLYTTDDWHYVLEASGADKITDRNEAIRTAADWAKENLGLKFEKLRKGGVIWNGIRTALDHR